MTDIDDEDIIIEERIRYRDKRGRFVKNPADAHGS